jgi:hypothetical protein
MLAAILMFVLFFFTSCDSSTSITMGQSQDQSQVSGSQGGGKCSYECTPIGTEFVDVTEVCDGDISSSNRVTAGSEPVSCVYGDAGSTPVTNVVPMNNPTPAPTAKGVFNGVIE